MGQEHNHKSCFLSTKPIHPSIHPACFTPVHNNGTNFDFRCKAANSYHSICWKVMNLLVMWASSVVKPISYYQRCPWQLHSFMIGICYLILQALVCYICASNECFVCMLFFNGLGWTIFFVSWASCYLILANWMTYGVVSSSKFELK
jgi:hypothetical protein